MDLLKTFWPTPFKIKKGDLTSFLVQLIIFLVITILVGVLIGIVASIPIVGIIAWIVGALMELYTLTGIVLCILKYLGIV